MPFPFFDTHCHLDLIHTAARDAGLDLDLLLREHNSGLRGLTQISTDYPSAVFGASLANDLDTTHFAIPPDDLPRWADEEDALVFYRSFFKKSRPDIRYTIGHHPTEVAHTSDTPRLLQMISDRSQDPFFAAVGEIGLDYYHHPEQKPLQLEVLDAFLAAALAVNRPVVIHSRDAFADTLDKLTPFSAQGGRGVMHCFTGDAEWARRFADLGFYISFAGIVTFRNASALRDAVKVIPRDRLLAETDAPYLTPAPFRGKLNLPGHTRYVVQTLAEECGLPVEDMAEQLLLNSQALFGGNAMAIGTG